MPKNNAFGARVRELRQGREISLDEMAATIGISPSHLSRLERGLTSPSFTIASKIAAALGIRTSELAAIQRNQGVVNRQLTAALTAAGMKVAIAQEITRKIATPARQALLDALDDHEH